MIQWYDKNADVKRSKKAIVENLKQADKHLKNIEESVDDPKTRKEVRGARKKIYKLLIGLAKVVGSVGLVALYTIVTTAAVPLSMYIANRITRRFEERAAQRRFNEWHERNGRPAQPRPNPAGPNPAVIREAQAAANAIQRAGEEARNARNEERRRELDLEDRPHAPNNTPGDESGRYRGLDMDSGYLVNLAKAIRIADAGVKGMKRGEHRMARDPEYVERLRNGGGGQRKPNAVQRYNQGMKTARNIGLGLAGAAGAVAAGLGVRKLLKGRKAVSAASNAISNTASTAAKAANSVKAAPLTVTPSKTTKVKVGGSRPKHGSIRKAGSINRSGIRGVLKGSGKSAKTVNHRKARAGDYAMRRAMKKIGMSYDKFGRMIF